MWGPYWGPAGNGIYEASIVWEEDAERQGHQLQAASSNRDGQNSEQPGSIGGLRIKLLGGAGDLEGEPLNDGMAQAARRWSFPPGI